MSDGKVPAGLMVAAGLGIAAGVGMGRQALHSARVPVEHFLYSIGSVMLFMALAGIACLCWYLVHGRWVPFRYRERVTVEARHREAVELLAGREIREEGPGVWSGPAEEA